MTGTIIFLALGVILLATLLAVVLLRETPDLFLLSSGNQGRESSRILTALDLNLPSGELAARIFAQEDLDFILREAPSLERIFLTERTHVAILWLRDARTCMEKVFHFYRMATRHSASLEFWTEIRVARDYFAFLVMSSTLQLLIKQLGPFIVRGMVARTFAVADRISAGVGRTLGTMDQSSLTKIKDDWARQAVPAD